MKLDTDVKDMSPGDRGEEIMRLRSLIRTHKGRANNARCWHTDLELYDHALPEGTDTVGMMLLPKDVLLKNCSRYIDGQQCALRDCSGKE